MSQSEQKVVQYLNEAHASELGLVHVLQAQIAITPQGSYRSALEKHLGETRDHGRRIEHRLADLGPSGNPFQTAMGWAEDALAQTFAFAKTPFDLLRGSGGEEKVLKNAEDTCATEALEIATYAALERLGRAVGDETTAKLAASIRSDEEKMLARVMREIPKLTDAVVGADVQGNPSYDVSETGAADAVRNAGQQAEKTARRAGTRARSTARQARKVPGVAQAEGQIKGAAAAEQDLPIGRYDSLTAADVLEKLSGLSQIDLAKVDAYERKNQSRSTVLGRTSALRGDEPWPGYDELNASEVNAIVGEGDDEDRVKRVRAYERSHKNRAAVIHATERETSNA